MPAYAMCSLIIRSRSWEIRKQTLSKFGIILVASLFLHEETQLLFKKAVAKSLEVYCVRADQKIAQT